MGIDDFYLSPQFFVSLEMRPANTQATVLAAAYALTKDKRIWERMHATSRDIKEAYKDQTLLRRRREVALTSAEIRQIYLDKKEQYAANPTNRALTDVLITGLMSGVFPELPPRRLMEYTELKPHPPPPRVRGQPPMYNYVINGPRRSMLMIFYRHKTCKDGKKPQTLPVPRELIPLFLKASREGREFLLLNDRGEKFTKASLHGRLMDIYGFGVDLLRSIFLSEMHEGTPSIRRMEKVAKMMGNSVGTQMACYVKKT